jgi:hypothetical protein
MASTVTVRDDTLTGQTLHEFELELANEQIDVRELIRSRVYQEVQDYNSGTGSHFRGLVQPEGSQQEGHLFKLSKRRQLDWNEQFEHALESFKAGRVIILVNDVQVESLDEKLDLSGGATVSFLKLVPLVGG